MNTLILDHSKACRLVAKYALERRGHTAIERENWVTSMPLFMGKVDSAILDWMLPDTRPDVRDEAVRLLQYYGIPCAVLTSCPREEVIAPEGVRVFQKGDDGINSIIDYLEAELAQKEVAR